MTVHFIEEISPKMTSEFIFQVHLEVSFGGFSPLKEYIFMFCTNKILVSRVTINIHGKLRDNK